MKKTFILGLVILITAIAVNAATRSRGASEKFQKTYSLNPGGKVSLQNVNGSLKVTTWNRNEVKVEAEKFADNKEDLDELLIDVSATSSEVVIKTRYPDDSHGGHGHDLAVEYVLTIPKGASLDKADLVNGTIEISGVTGEVEASTVNGTIAASGLADGCALHTVNGKINAEFDTLPSKAEVKLKSVNGGIVLRIPAKAGADVRASVTTGRISNEFGLQSSQEKDEGSFVKVGDSLHGEIGGGGATVRAETVNGSIKILKSER